MEERGEDSYVAINQGSVGEGCQGSHEGKGIHLALDQLLVWKHVTDACLSDQYTLHLNRGFSRNIYLSIIRV